MALQFFPLLPTLRPAVLASDSALHDDPCCSVRTERLEAMAMAAAQGNAECLPWVMMCLERNDARTSPQDRKGGAHAELP